MRTVEGSRSGRRAAVNTRVVLSQAGLPDKTVAAWLKSAPKITGNFSRDANACARYWRGGTSLAGKLPKKPQRDGAQKTAADYIHDACRLTREHFLQRHAATVYRKLTKNLANFVRLDKLVYDAARLVPGLTPTRAEVDAEMAMMQSEKDGAEIDQGLFLNRVLANAETGMHLCHAMLLPKPEAIERIGEFLRNGVVDFGVARVERQGKAAVVTLSNKRFLNAEDNNTLDATEAAVDIAILDPISEICVLRGDTVEHPKYAGRKIFSSGINLTHLYRGKIPYLFYIVRDMGVVNKMLRGLARESANPDELSGGTREKPWIAGVDAFAIGGGCQYLLVMDYVVAASDAYLTLPARKEGIIPGAANLRLTRFVGARAARQAIMVGRRFDCDSPEGRMICDEIVAPDQVDAGIERAVETFTGSGIVSAAGNRRAFRVGEEPLDQFRRYMATYAREQAYCHFSPALIANLEHHWNAAQREL